MNPALFREPLLSTLAATAEIRGQFDQEGHLRVGDHVPRQAMGPWRRALGAVATRRHGRLPRELRLTGAWDYAPLRLGGAPIPYGFESMARFAHARVGCFGLGAPPTQSPTRPKP